MPCWGEIRHVVYHVDSKHMQWPVSFPLSPYENHHNENGLDKIVHPKLCCSTLICLVTYVRSLSLHDSKMGMIEILGTFWAIAQKVNETVFHIVAIRKSFMELLIVVWSKAFQWHYIFWHNPGHGFKPQSGQAWGA